MAEVSLTIGGESFTLKCTLDAFRTIPATLGGFMGTYNAIASADPNTCAFIVAAATGKARDGKEQERIAQLLFESGLSADVFERVTEYVQLLQNGGKKAEAPKGSAGE